MKVGRHTPEKGVLGLDLGYRVVMVGQVRDMMIVHGDEKLEREERRCCFSEGLRTSDRAPKRSMKLTVARLAPAGSSGC